MFGGNGMISERPLQQLILTQLKPTLLKLMTTLETRGWWLADVPVETRKSALEHKTLLREVDDVSVQTMDSLWPDLVETFGILGEALSHAPTSYINSGGITQLYFAQKAIAEPQFHSGIDKSAILSIHYHSMTNAVDWLKLASRAIGKSINLE